MNKEELIILYGCFSLLGIMMLGCFVGDYFFNTKLLDDALLHTILGGLFGFLGAHVSSARKNKTEQEQTEE